MSNYASKNKLDHITGVHTFDLADKKYFIALKADVDKLDIHELVNVPISLNNSKTKEDNFDISKLETVAVDLKKQSSSR